MRLVSILFSIVCFLPLFTGCDTSTATADYADVAAADLAISTMIEEPAPQPLPPLRRFARCDCWLRRPG